MSLSAKVDTIPRLLGEAFEQLGTLANTEAELARTELSEKVTQVGRGIVFLVGAAILVIPALVILFMALALYLTTNYSIPPTSASFMVGGLAGVFGAIMGFMGLNHLRTENLKPKVTLRQVRCDLETAKDMMR
jgi:hypothetical protein